MTDKYVSDKGKYKNLQKQLNEEEIGNQPEKEFRIMIGWSKISDKEWLHRSRSYKEKRGGGYHCGSVVKNPAGIHEDMGLIHSPAYWVKDLVFPGAVAQIIDVARVWHCCGWDIVWQCQLPSTSSLGTCMCCRCGPKQKKISYKKCLTKSWKI